MACRFHDLILQLNKEIFSDNYELLFAISEEIVDDIMYMQDIFSLKIIKINYVLSNCLFYYVILPLLCGKLSSTKIHVIMINTSIYVLTLLFNYILDESFLNMLYAVVLNEQITIKLKGYIENIPPQPANYSFKWKNQKVINADLDYASCNYLYYSLYLYL